MEIKQKRRSVLEVGRVIGEDGDRVTDTIVGGEAEVAVQEEDIGQFSEVGTGLHVYIRQ